jgi:WhiB family transcriptional regulator, redox-sensing transcriptional regulator
VSEWTWLDQAACVGTDPELFFQFGDGAYTAARRVCAGCPVRTECLGKAMAEESPEEGESQESNRERRHGIRAGLTAHERWRLVYPAAVAA